MWLVLNQSERSSEPTRIRRFPLRCQQNERTFQQVVTKEITSLRRSRSELPDTCDSSPSVIKATRYEIPSDHREVIDASTHTFKAYDLERVAFHVVFERLRLC